MYGKLAIVSNRLPVSIDGASRCVQPTVGGLASALRSVAAQPGVSWFGWPGTEIADGDRAWVNAELAERRLVPVDVSAAEVASYYDGFANGVLWPLFHYLVDKVNLDAESDWESFKKVNVRFADAVAGTFDGDVIWVHDYQLALTPRLLRERAPNARIGFFLHVPFPSEQIFRILPWREEVLRGLLGADVIGFQTAQDANHFITACAQVLGLDDAVDVLAYDGRAVRVGAYPISIDAKAISRLAGQEDVLAEAGTMRAESQGRQIMLGVDRLDYTKGIRRHVRALERAFEEESELAARVKLIQVAVPTRLGTPAYAQFNREVHEVVGRVNAKFASVQVTPIHLLQRALTMRELAPLYVAADVMLVTPMRDGMNLVAKEYVASRNEDTGVLILSEFAGAAAELSEALIVNPNDLRGMAQAMKRALAMSRGEQRARMASMRRKVFAHDVEAWSRDFLLDLTISTPASTGVPVPPPSKVRLLGSAPSLILLLDYDGTLLPHASVPELAAPDDELVRLLSDLAGRPDTRVAVVSGRAAGDLEHWLGALPVDLFAEHGFFQRLAGEPSWVPAWPVSDDWKADVLPILAAATRRTVGSFVEEKVTCLAWHYRSADPELAAERVRDLKERLEPVAEARELDLLVGAKVFEVRVRGVSKRMAATRVLAAGSEGASIIAVGDDSTDEELFAALPPGATTIHVGDAPTKAAFRLRDPSAVRSFLTSLAARQT